MKSITQQYDEGYERAIEGKSPDKRRASEAYLRGYNAGLEYVRDLETEQAEIRAEYTS